MDTVMLIKAGKNCKLLDLPLATGDDVDEFVITCLSRSDGENLCYKDFVNKLEKAGEDLAELIFANVPGRTVDAFFKRYFELDDYRRINWRIK